MVLFRLVKRQAVSAFYHRVEYYEESLGSETVPGGERSMASAEDAASPPLPDAGPRSDRPRRGGRESKFLAVVTTMITEVSDVLR